MMETSNRFSFPRAALVVAIAAAVLPISGCETAPKKTPVQALNEAFGAMKQAVDADVDEGDHADMEAARDRYRKGVALLKDHPDKALEAAEDAEVLAQYAQATVVAKVAADNAAKARKEIEDLKRFARGGDIE